MQSHGNYSYYTQPLYHSSYRHQGLASGYPYGQETHHENRYPPFIPPTPVRTASHAQINGRYSWTSMSVIPKIAALKSALRKPAIRKATYRGYPERVPEFQSYNPRVAQTNHLVEFRPLHMFMLFIGNNELRLENIMKPAMDELRSTVLKMWPDGIESDFQHGHNWTVRFRNNPWSLQGPHYDKARDIVVQLFTLFARRGFTFLTSTNTGNPPPRLIFEVTSADTTSHFFLAYFSHGGRRLTFIKPPLIIDHTLGNHLKAVLPRKVDETVIQDLRIFEIRKRNGFGPVEVEPSFFLMHVLKILSELGFNLLATVPLGRRGPLGVRVRKEMLVFRGADRHSSEN